MPKHKRKNSKTESAPRQNKRLTLNRIFLLVMIVGVVVSLATAYKQSVYERALRPPEGIGREEVSFAMVDEEQGEVPLEMRIPGILEVEIMPQSLNAGAWSVSETGANYLLDSARMGQKGNMIVYGHNYPEILGSLTQVRVGQEIRLVSEAGEEKVYEVSEVVEVGVDEVEWLQDTEGEVLTIYTCSGWLDSKRWIVRARLRE